MAVIDRDALADLGVGGGDFVAIEGRDGGRAVARVWPSDAGDAGRGIVRIDGQLRQQANVGIDDHVEVEPTEVRPADRLRVVLPETVRLQGDVESYLRDQLADQAVTPNPPPSRTNTAISPEACRIDRTPLRAAGPNATPVDDPPTFTPTKTATATPTRNTADTDMSYRP